MAKAETTGEKRRAKERKEDLMRLKRVEQIYVSILTFSLPLLLTFFIQNAVLPVLSGWVLVLLKLLLATVSAGTGPQPPQSSTSSVFPPGVASREFHIVSLPAPVVEHFSR